ncbi:MAG: HAMP domain-containing histidine kinase [Comamonadaceae bacterium]|nr:HAMP domain-containing histidine kinase [Comamonadaceae bacterium]
MNAIIGFSEFLADNKLSEIERNDFFQIVKLNSEMLLELIDDILDISLIETGQLRVKTEKVSLNKIMDETYQLFKGNEKLKLSHIDFTYFVNDIQKDIVILSDSFRLKQILSNLIDNAIKFTESGQVSFTYKIIETDNRKFIKFQVDDSGIGIDNKYQNRIFERFFRITTDTNHLYKGSGIGLSIVKSLVDLMGGEVWYTSIPNNGSTFFFTIPYYRK